MSEERELARLREAFQAEAAGEREVDAERVWRAVAGELSPEERREIADLVALDPGYAEAWRLAVELQSTMGRGEVVPFSKRRWLERRSWLKAAAVVLAVAGLGVLVARLASPPGPVYRQPGTEAIDSLVEGETLPRSRCLLRWTELPEGARYTVRVTTAELAVLADETGLRESEYLVPEDRLEEVAPGAMILWQIEARLPDGSVVASETFENELE